MASDVRDDRVSIMSKKTAVITGAGQGLGRAMAERLSTDGFHVVCVDVNSDSAAETAQFVGGEAHACDITDRDAVHRLGNLVSECHVLVNNAGVWSFESLLESTEHDAERVIHVNVLGTMWCTQAFAPHMRRAGGGSIINVSSAAAWTQSPGIGVYPATKTAVESLTKTFALELGPDNIRVNAIGPGLIVSDGTAANYEGNRVNERAQGVPLRRVGSPVDIANVVSFLAGPDSTYVSGQVMYVDGGISAGTQKR
jgi:3-oxoacyl-[acyl-carrier protein] reductase